MRQLITIALWLCCGCVFAQDGPKALLGSWVKAKVEYRDGTALPDEDGVKHSYLRYSFEKTSRLFVALAYEDKGMAMAYSMGKGILEVKSPQGFTMNRFLVERQTEGEMVLLQAANGGFSDDGCVRYYFTAEPSYQAGIPLRAEDVLAVTAGDTLFAASPKVYAKYSGPVSFHDFLTANIPSYNTVQSSDNTFLASFIVRKTGEVDSLQILESLNPVFDAQFTKAFHKAKGKWIPATLGGRNVDVRMLERFRFVSSRNFLPLYDYSSKARSAIQAKEYLKALYYLDMGLKKVPTDADLLYQRAVVRLRLGNRAAACEDLHQIKALGKQTADALISQSCTN
ncbi:hypothetical protein ACD591_09975 [Rufibacter glacialis]|uniref:TonB C-terminal domain-containing protein n=1 Tax=Rufibacter glacialis TaxID=1259555 RepID=A0A5M8QBN3_9BACT|nr:tetratricopeptide repeat protein [Rufibacter glacialis]KAA6431902.1 hypothetical protein FOE74_17495 [Rufibacter glacialis]GGK80574.1 hypothetical protein GCM10011405_30420 [Rufibacter glacialis]